MFRNFVILMFFLFSFYVSILNTNAQTLQIDKSVESVERISPSSKLLKINQKRSFQIDSIVSQAIVGRICDPIFTNELGISVLTSTKSPKIGFGIDYFPQNHMILNKIRLIEFSYRKNNNNYLRLTSGVESFRILGKYSWDIKFEYSLNNLKDIGLVNYSRFSSGVIYRGISWLNIGALIGRDNFKNLGYDILLKYTIHKSLAECPFYVQYGELFAKIEYWNNNFNYTIKVNSPLSNVYSLGLGYEKLFEHKEFLLTLRYLIRY